MPLDNPFIQVFDALWTMVEDHPDIDTLVLRGNRVKYNSLTDRDPLKQNISTGDTPELVLASDGFGANMTNTSCSTMCLRRYSWLVSTGDFRLNKFLLPVEWMLYVAMHDWRRVLTALEWPVGWKFVKRMAIVDVTTGISDPERNRSIRGWSALWRLEVEMHFPTADIEALLAEESSSSSVEDDTVVVTSGDEVPEVVLGTYSADGVMGGEVLYRKDDASIFMFYPQWVVMLGENYWMWNVPAGDPPGGEYVAIAGPYSGTKLNVA
jgi:hypothetical protein